MNFSLKRNIYESLPLSLKRCISAIPFSWIAGSHYRKVYRRGTWFDKADRATLNAYQEQELGKILRFVVQEVPAYQSLKDIVTRMRPFEALKAFPFLDKDTMQSNPEKYLPLSFKKIKNYEVSTGGTSGNQLHFYLDDHSHYSETAFMHRQWKRVGYTSKHRKATFRGVSFPMLHKGKFWQHNPIYNEVQFSPFHISDDNLSSYLEEFRKNRFNFLHGYPSSIDTLAEFILRNNLTKTITPIKAVLLGSEGATQKQRERIENAFNTRVFSWYGHSERVVLAGECEQDASYHHFPDYGILEIVKNNVESCVEIGERGEIVGTGLLNYSMPLIRYRTGDFATRLSNDCKCGRCWDRFSDVQGRWKQEMIHGINGSYFSLAALNMHDDVFDHVKRFQYHQTDVGECILKIVPAPTFDKEMINQIKFAYSRKLGKQLLMRVELVQDIPLTVRGKHRMLVSLLD